MPVLHEEVSLYPATLLDDGFDAAPDSQWMVLYTKPRQEKAVARDLLGQQIPFYLPLVKQTHQYGRRKVSSRCPLFGGYIFLYGAESDRVRTLATNRVLRVLPVDDAERLVHDLRQFQIMIAADAPLTVESRLQPGNPVRVKKGPFAGIEGVVVRRRERSRLLVSIDFLQRGASIEIEDYLLEPLA